MIPLAIRMAVLETEHLLLRPLAASDADAIFPLMDDPDVRVSWDAPDINDPDRLTAIVGGRVAEMDEGRGAYWSIRRLADGRLLGCCDVSQIDRRHKRADLGVILERGAWEPGYAQEALRAVIAYAASSGLRRLTARTLLGERRSETLLETHGFQEEGLLRGHVIGDGERRDCRLFGLFL